jgi:hypothetical protein
MKKDFGKIALIVGAALLTLWIFSGLVAFIMISGDAGEKAGFFGDSFGGFNALVSVLGFGTVIYSLHKQHQDAKESDERHKQMMERQQAIFEQDSKMKLFEKRAVIFDAVRMYTHLGSTDSLSKARIQDFSIECKHAQFIFPIDSKIPDYIDSLIKKGYALVGDRSYFTIEPETDNSTQIGAIQKEFEVECDVNCQKVFKPYLSLTEFALEMP